MAEGREHRYSVEVVWTGNRGGGTSSYTGYSRAHEHRAPGKPAIPGSSDSSFRGDPTRWNPEELLVASLASCHQLWYLHLCAAAGIVVAGYEDHAEGVMVEEPGGAGSFASVTLRPRVRLLYDSDEREALRLHDEASRMCFVARSVRFPVRHEPVFERA